MFTCSKSNFIQAQVLMVYFFALQICEEIGVKAPVNVKMFTGKGKPVQH